MNGIAPLPSGWWRDADRVRRLVAEHGSPLAVLDCDVVREQARRLRAALPGIALYYAVKALPHPAVVTTLDEAGIGFDLAGNGEIDLARKLRINPRRTLHTHPIKRDADIRAALRFGCTSFVVDNPDELRKFLPYRHRVGLLLRIAFRAEDAVVDLSRKFGCDPDEAESLLVRAARMGIHVKGLGFHVGSQARSPAAQVAAIERCATLFARADALGLPAMRMLDIGGGFPVPYTTGLASIEAYCAPLRRALARLPAHVRFAAEPGRFLVAPAVTCIASVVGHADRDGRRWVYLDDGVYGSYSGRLFDHAHYPLSCIPDNAPACATVLAGPTCDSIDIVAEDIELPRLRTGDLVLGHMMGAYTLATATDFNSLPRAEVLVVNAPDERDRVAYIA